MQRTFLIALVIIPSLFLGGCSVGSVDGKTAEEWRDEARSLQDDLSATKTELVNTKSILADATSKLNDAKIDGKTTEEWRDEAQSLQKQLNTTKTELLSANSNLIDARNTLSDAKSKLNVNNSQEDTKVYVSGSFYTPSVIESQIDGDFNGWDGETIFKFTNGQIWQQDSYDYTYHYAFRPEVIVYKSGSSFVMKVEDVEDTITVKRIK